MGNNELIAYSLPSHPGTKLPGHQYGVPEPTQQRRAVALREGLGKFHLLGISLGGSIAQHFAGTYPEMVDPNCAHGLRAAQRRRIPSESARRRCPPGRRQKPDPRYRRGQCPDELLAVPRRCQIKRIILGL
jgi:pimeloyl-ACP methyl ester carboxylesterase